ncbi:MAG: hypothetical protein AAF138_08240 [Planctomycetota bacterium]
MVSIAGISDSGALPALAKSMRFAAQRNRLLAHNIANLTTPGFQPKDADPRAFQATLAEAVNERRARTGGLSGKLELPETSELRRDARGNLRLEPRTPSTNILGQDRNNSDLERSMQSLAENTAFFRVAVDLMRFEGDRLSRAIRETA